MKKIFLLLTVLFLVATTFQSCKKDDLSTDDAKVLIAQADQDLNSLVTSLKDGEAVALIEKFANVAKKKIATSKESEEWIDAMFEALGDVIDFEQMEQELNNERRFYFDRYLGKYTWDHATGSWVKTALDHIELEFPSEEGMTTNDILFSFDSYTDAQATINDEIVWALTSLHASVKQNGIKLIGFDVNEITFDTNLFYFYTKIDVSLFVSPVTANILLDNKTPTNFYAAYDISNGTQSFGMSANLNTLVVLTEDFNEQDLKDVSGEININNLDFVYDVNLESIADYDPDVDPTDAQINADVNVNVFVDETQIGSLLLENEVVYIVYNDGTREKFEDAFAGVIADLNEFMNETKNTRAYKKQKSELVKFILFKSKGFKNTKAFVKNQYKALSK